MRHVAVGLLFAALLLAGCEKSRPPTAGGEDAGIRASNVPESADVEAKINGRVNDLFPQPQKAEAHRLFDRIKDAVEAGDDREAAAVVSDLLQLTFSTNLKEPDGETTSQAVEDLFDLLFEFVGVEFEDDLTEDDLAAPELIADLIEQTQDGDDGTVALAVQGEDNLILTDSSFAGTFIEGDDLDEDLVIVIERLTEEERENGQFGGACLPTESEQREGCYRFDRYPEGSFSQEVRVGVCQKEPLQEEFQLFRFETFDEGDVPLPLPNVAFPELDCGGFTSTLARSSGSPLPWSLAEAAWGATAGRLLDWLAPRPLRAVNVGFGGATTNFSRIGWVKELDVDILEGDGQVAVAGTQLSVDPQVRVTHLPEDDHTGTVAGVPVTFEVIAGGGTVDGGSSVTVATGSAGRASVPWTLGSTGTNQVSASVPGETVVFTATGTGNLLASCTPDPGGDQLSRGYYYPDYPASTLDRVDMFFSADAAGSYEIVLTAREDTYDGTVIEDDTVTVALSSDPDDNQRATFLFGGATVAEDTVAFEMKLVSGPGTPSFAVSTEETCPLVETTDTSPPLSTDRFGGRGVGADVYGSVN